MTTFPGPPWRNTRAYIQNDHVCIICCEAKQTKERIVQLLNIFLRKEEENQRKTEKMALEFTRGRN